MDGGAAAVVGEQMRRVRVALGAFADQGRTDQEGGEGSAEEDKVAVAWYWDGQREELTRRMLDFVSARPDWLLQVWF